MDDPFPALAWAVALFACCLLHAVAAHVQVAFRFLGPVTLQALVDRIGPARTDFLRKSLRSPTAFYFSLQLTTAATLLLLLAVFLAPGARVPLPGERSFVLSFTGHLAHDAVLLLVLFNLVALLAYVLPALASRAFELDRLSVMERSLPAMRVVHAMLSPLSRLLARWSDHEDEDEEEPGDEELDAFIDVGQREGILEEGEGELLRNVIVFGDTRVREVMTPRTDVVGISTEANVRELADLMAQCRFSRIPIYEDQLDDIRGIVSLKDVLQSLGEPERSVTSLMKPAYIVPESKRVAELLRDMQARRLQVAVVIDEYGGTAGIVTLEDLVEEIVGEIREEHETEGEDVVEGPDGGWIVKGSASVHDVAEALDADLAVEDTASVGGMLLSLFDRVPAPGEVVDHSGYRFEVREADRKRVRLVHVQQLAEGAPEEGRRGLGSG